jgi:hypothetical protein
MLYVVWYFVSGCMLTFGATLIWVWWRLRGGDGRFLFAAIPIGLLYAGIGIFGLIYRAGNPFMGFFGCLGVVLLLSAYALAPSRTSAVAVRSSRIATDIVRHDHHL